VIRGHDKAAVKRQRVAELEAPSRARARSRCGRSRRAALAGGVQVVTPSSPLGRAVAGKRVGDDVELQLRDRLRTFAIVAIA
jgi:GreA/GreB family transcription elongation factor